MTIYNHVKNIEWMANLYVSSRRVNNNRASGIRQDPQNPVILTKKRGIPRNSLRSALNLN